MTYLSQNLSQCDKKTKYVQNQPCIRYFEPSVRMGTPEIDVTDLGVFVMRSHNWINASKLSQDQPKFI